MRYIVYGAGGIGGVVGARLAQHDHDVVLIARGRHAAAIRADGLRLDAPDGSHTMRLPVVEHPRELELADGDVVLLAMKSQDTTAALDALAPVAPPTLPIVCLQNGVDNERMALRRFGDVYAVPVLCPTGHLEPGVVTVYSAPVSGVFDIGRYPSGVDDICRGFATSMSASTFVSVARADVMRWKYAKLLNNLGNSIEALCGSGGLGGGGSLEPMVRAEGEAALRAAGVDFASQDEDRERRGELLRIERVGGQRRAGGSTWQSLARGTSIETDHLNGEIVLLGRLHGVPTPVNELLQRLMTEAAATGAPPATMTEHDILAQLPH